MKKKSLLALTAMLFAGCASIERTSPGRMDKFDVIGGDTPAEQTVCVRNYGFGLLYVFTAICDNVSLDNNIATLDRACKEVGSYRIASISHTINEDALWSFLVVNRKTLKTNCFIMPAQKE